jgi:hypothetical protein
MSESRISSTVARRLREAEPHRVALALAGLAKEAQRQLRVLGDGARDHGLGVVGRVALRRRGTRCLRRELGQRSDERRDVARPRCGRGSRRSRWRAGRARGSARGGAGAMMPNISENASTSGSVPSVAVAAGRRRAAPHRADELRVVADDLEVREREHASISSGGSQARAAAGTSAAAARRAAAAAATGGCSCR